MTAKPTEGVLSRTFISTLGMAAQGLARFAYTLAIGRIAGPESLGEMSTLLSIAVYASLFWPAAAGVGASRFLPVSSLAAPALATLKRSFYISVLVLTLLSAIVAWWLVGDIAQILSTAALVLSYSGYVFVRGVLMGEDRISRSTIVDTISSFVAITALILVLIAGWDWAILLPLALSYTVFTLASWPKGDASAMEFERREILRFTRDSAITLIATGGLLPATMILVRAYEPAQVAGLFAAGLSLATPANLVAQAVNQVLIPHFARMHNQPPAALRSSLQRIFVVTAMGFLTIFGALVLLAPWILSTLYGERYASGALEMQLLLLGVCAMSMMAAPSAYLTAVGRQGLNSRIWVLAMISGTVVMLIASPIFGQWGTLAGFLLGACGGSATVIISGLVLPPIGTQLHTR